MPPSLAQRVLLRFLRNDLAEEVLGDLDEKFYTMARRSPARAKINYWYQVLHYMRPFAVKKFRSRSNQFTMLGSYFRISYRNLLKNKGYSFINIGGLAAGMAIAMLIGLWIHDEVTFNRCHEGYGTIAQVMQHQTYNDHTRTFQSVPRPLENALRSAYGGDFTRMSIASWINDHVLNAGNKSITMTGNFFQSDFPEMIGLEMIEGSREGLADPTSIFLSASGAKALFGSADPINQAIRIDGRMDVKVSGVYKDIPHNSSFHDLAFMASWDLFASATPWVQRAESQWGNSSFQLFVQLAPDADIDAISSKIKDIKFDLAKDEQKFNPEIFLFPMRDWHLRSEWKNGQNAGGRIQLVWMFAIIGLFVVVLACINFMNLSTARSEKRAKEVGIRMAIGSVRGQLIHQFLSESFLVTFMAFVLAGVLVVILLPGFNVLAAKHIEIDWAEPVLWFISMIAIVITGLIAGSYPAFYLSSFKPARVLKGSFKAGRFSSLPRKIMVVVQFTVSVALIIGTVIVYQQIEFTRERPIGYDRNGLIMIQMASDEFYGKHEVLRAELKNAGAIEDMALSGSPMTSIWQNSGGFEWPGKDPDLQGDFATLWITHDYGKTIGWKVKEGRDMLHEFASDSSAVLLNEAAVRFMGIKEPIGTTITWGKQKYHVIGVVEDIVMHSPYLPVKQAIYLLNYNNANWITLRLNPEKSAAESLALAEKVFKKIIPSAPFDYKFVDEEYALKFSTEERIGKLASIFSVLAIIISCLGIFGLASFLAEQRTKEIGIRKVLGASVLNLWGILSKDFVVLVLIACIVAVPLACLVLSGWLTKYEYHTQISAWVPVASTMGALIITLLTVSFQAIRAALANPVRSLRSE